MSMFNQIETIVNSTVQVFIKEVAGKYKIKIDELDALWISSSSGKVEKKVSPKSELDDLLKLTIKDLKTKLSEVGVVDGVSGKTKETLAKLYLSKKSKTSDSGEETNYETDEEPLTKPKSPMKSPVKENKKPELKTTVKKIEKDESESEDEKPVTKKIVKKPVTKIGKDESEDEKHVKKVVKKPNVDSDSEDESKKSKSPKKTEESDDESVTSSKKSSPGGGSTCSYTFTKPPRAGELCGTKVRDGGEFCSKHKKVAEKSPAKEKTTMPKPKSDSSQKTDSNENVSKKVVIRLNREIGKYWHPDSGFVFKSPEDKVVIGRLVDGVVTPLTPAEIVKCKSLSFPLVNDVPEKPAEKPAPKSGKILSGISLSGEVAKQENSKAKLGGVKKLGEEVKALSAAITAKPEKKDEAEDLYDILEEMQEEEFIEDDE